MKNKIVSYIMLLALFFGLSIYAQENLTTFDLEQSQWNIATDLSVSNVVTTAWGFKGSFPLTGDMDGDGENDLIIFYEGRWFIKSLDNRVIAWDRRHGYEGTIPLVEDMDGDGVDDLIVYDPNTLKWFVSTMDGENLFWGERWGLENITPMAGDINGDGKGEFVFWSKDNKRWYAMSLDKYVVEFGMPYGFGKSEQFLGDFDGDGSSDFGIYGTESGRWFVYSFKKKQNLKWNWLFGDKNSIPVVGDFLGNGKDDYVVYNQLDGIWKIDDYLVDINFGDKYKVPVSRVVPEMKVEGAYQEPILTPCCGFLYKPETTLILLPEGNSPGRVNEASEVLISRTPEANEDDIMYRCNYTGQFGANPKWRFSGANGCSFGAPFYVVVKFKNGNLQQPWIVQDGCVREPSRNRSMEENIWEYLLDESVKSESLEPQDLLDNIIVE